VNIDPWALFIGLTGLGFVIAASNAAIRVLFALGREHALPGRWPPCRAARPRRRDRLRRRARAGTRTAADLRLRRCDHRRVPPRCGRLAVVLVYLTGNIAVIRAFRREFRDQFRPPPHLIIPAIAAIVFLFPLWGIIHLSAYTLMNLLPFAALGWLALGVIAATVFRARRPASFQALGQIFMPSEEPTR
jgi:hypothetical protein